MTCHGPHCLPGIPSAQADPLSPSTSPGRGHGILGTGSYLPARAVANDEVAARTNVTDEWIIRKTGIRNRYYAAEDEATSDLAAHAARAALEDAGIHPSQLSYVVVATSTPDHPQPATAALVQHLIGARNAAAFDVNAVCTGFLFALNVAVGIVPHDGYGLVIGADIYSRIIDPADRRTAVLFGDGAGAVVLGPVERPAGHLATRLRTFGDMHTVIRVPAGGSRLPARLQQPDSGEHYFAMQGRAVRDFVTEQLPVMVKDILYHADLAPEAVEHFIPHQANGQMLREIVPTLGLGKARHHLIVEQTANTGAASVPITLDAARREGCLAPGAVVLLSAFGGGMSIGATLLRWAE